jgi:hypothetical protein
MNDNMCKDGKCGHFDSLQSEQDFIASLDPVLIRGKKLKAVLAAQATVDRVQATQAEEREEQHSKLAKQVASGEVKMSDAMKQVEALADRHEKEQTTALQLYADKMEPVVKGTALEGLFNESVKPEHEKVLVQTVLSWAKTLDIGIIHRNPEIVLGGDDGEPLINGKMPKVIRELGELLAQATGGHLAGIVAVPKNRR